jgi:hypothetical protein
MGYKVDMRLALKPHPDSPCPAVTHIVVDAARPTAGGLMFTYVVTGTIRDLRIPQVAAPARADQLWQHTCFEAFFRTAGRNAYYEFNVAPSRQWAIYGFTDYRSGMRAATEVDMPPIAVETNPERLTLRVALELDLLPDLAPDAPWRLGLSAVIEETTGRKSYWALAHPPGQPDFHHSDCFAHELQAASRPRQ